ncbi:MAG: twin-arginine translocase TatA/TatE family subunit [Desulfopila sp.]|jgi:sec-independent protein translocase protein TatB|nr:twin-arginine translocase TatA/TatE family subunit [Desulfopila sp.]
MFGIGFPELILILALALIVVGPDKLPELARSIAKTIVDLKKTAEGIKSSMEIDDNPLSEIKPTLEDAARNFKETLLEEKTNTWKTPEDLDKLYSANTEIDNSAESGDHDSSDQTPSPQAQEYKKDHHLPPGSSDSSKPAGTPAEDSQEKDQQ